MGSAVTDPYGQAYRLYCCARVRISMGKAAEALEPLQTALGIWREIGDLLGQIQTLETIAAAHRERGAEAEAQRADDEAHRFRALAEDEIAPR